MRNCSEFDTNTTFSGHSQSCDPGNNFIHITEESYEKFVFISNFILTPSIILIGLLGNSLGLGVLWTDTRQQKLSVYTYLFSLTFVDSIYLFLGLIRNIPHVIKTYDEQFANYVAEYMKIGTIYLDMVFSHTSRAILIVISLERLIALIKPFAVKHCVLTRHPKKIVAVCFLFNVVFLLPYPFCLEVNSYVAGNTTDYFLQFRPHAAKAMDKYMVVQTVVDYFVPPIILLLTNSAIPVTYANILRRRLATFSTDPTGMGSHQTKITMTVFFITLLYLLCSLPNLFIKVLAFTDDGYSFDGEHKLVFWFFIDLSNLFEYINAANDSVIYVLVSNHYRRIFKEKYCRFCLRRPQYSDGDPGTTSVVLTISSGATYNEGRF